MGLGLLMLQSLEASELRAVLAHEFGHYHGGDTRIGPWIYKTREAIGRTLSALADHSSLLQKPFDWYGRLFLRVTLAVSRHQERQADALAASVEGASAAAAGLRAMHAAALAFPSYWYGAVAPAAAAGFHPPLAAGFAEFTAQPHVKELIRKAVEEEMASPTADPYDTHPPLRDRLAALGAQPAPAARRPDASALALLDDLPGLERALLAALPDVPHGAALVTADWDAIAGPVCVPQWREIVGQHRRLLGGVTPSGLPALDWERLGRAVLALQLGHPGETGDAPDAAEWVIEAGLALALVERGYDVVARPGQSIRLEKGPDVVDLGRLREQVIAKPDAWVSFCARAGIAEIDLGHPASPAPRNAGSSAPPDSRAS